LVLFLLTLTVIATFSQEPSKEVRKLIKDAAKLTRNESLTEAEALLRQAAELAPTRSEAKIELAYVMVKQHRVRNAYDLCFPIAEKEPTNARAFAVLGTVLLSAGRFSEARVVLTNALRLDRKEDLGWLGMGMLDFYENRIEDSLSKLRVANELNADEPDYLFALAQVAARQELYKLAAETYDHFLDVSNNNDKERRTRIRALVRFLKYLGDTGTLYDLHGAESSSVRFDLIGDRPIIQVKINDKSKPLNFVLDTGSGISVLSEAAAKRLGIHAIARGGYARGIGGTGKFEIVYGLIRHMSIGDVRIRNVPVFLRQFHDLGQQVDGYIGLALISKFLTTVDYGERTLSLTKKDADTAAFASKQPFSLPLRLTQSGFLSGEVALEGIESPLNFIVDTGASVSVISDRVARTDQMSTFQDPERFRVFGSAGVRDDVPSFMLPSITFGTHSRKSIKAVALDLDVINEASGFEQAGILGGNFLKHYRLTFDFKSSKVVFEALTPEN